MNRAEYIRNWRRANPDKVKAYARTHYLRNRAKKLQVGAAWRAANPLYAANYHRKNAGRLVEAGRDRMYRRKYGITSTQYAAMLASQGGVCVLCQRPPKKYRLAVDHDHVTGRIRGILCGPCNHGVMGFVDGVPGYLRRLNDYAAR